MARKPGRPRKKQPVTELSPETHTAVTAAVQSAYEPAPEPHPTDREASREARSETRQGSGRRERRPLGVARQRLYAEVPSGMTGRWVNDDPGRIEQAIDGGYQFISSDKEVIQSREGCRTEIVGVGRSGGAQIGYLMAIPTVLYEEDQAAKMSQIDDTEDSIQRGPVHQATDKDPGGFYSPGEGIKIRPNTSAER